MNFPAEKPIVNSIGMELVYIPAGKFMKEQAAGPDEVRSHRAP
jgi:hypothetical protein